MGTRMSLPAVFSAKSDLPPTWREDTFWRLLPDAPTSWWSWWWEPDNPILRVPNGREYTRRQRARRKRR